MLKFSPLSLATAMCALVLGLLLAGAGTSISHAAKVYKWTDEDGNISYRDKPPPSKGGQVEEKNIDPNKNIVQPFHIPSREEPDEDEQTANETPVFRNTSDDNERKTGKKAKAGIVEDGKLDPVDPSSGANPNPLQIRPAPLVTPAPLSAPPAPTAPPTPVTPPPAAVPPLPAPTSPGA